MSSSRCGHDCHDPARKTSRLRNGYCPYCPMEEAEMLYLAEDGLYTYPKAGTQPIYKCPCCGASWGRKGYLRAV